MTNTIFKIKNLNLVIDNHNLLNQFSFDFLKGERVGLTGPSGCGKSTFIKSIINNSFPKKSTYDFFSNNSIIISSYIPQNNGLLPWFSLKKNLSIFSKDTSFTENVVEHFSLKNSLYNFPHQLSGGEYQRATLANALINKPDLYIADEPLTELDITNKWKLLSFWSKHILNTNASLLLVSHDIETLSYLCDRIIVLSDKPSIIIKEIVIYSQHPRNLDFLVSTEFIDAKKELLKIISKEKLG